MSEDWGAPVEPEPTALVDDQAQLVYPTVEVWFEQWLRLVYARHIDGRNRVWAAEWWKSMEAQVRLEALWRAWENLRRDPATGMSIWFRDHADHHMRILMDPNESPFAGTHAEDEQNKNRKGQPLPHSPAPAGYFD